MNSHETSDVHPGTLLIVAIFFVFLLGVSLFVVGRGLSLVKHRPRNLEGVQVAKRSVPPAPLLETGDGSLFTAYWAYRDKEQKLLGSYGWVDQTHTTAHIPIDRAMELYAKH
jgi:hypothetical protein